MNLARTFVTPKCPRAVTAIGSTRRKLGNCNPMTEEAKQAVAKKHRATIAAKKAAPAPAAEPDVGESKPKEKSKGRGKDKKVEKTPVPAPAAEESKPTQGRKAAAKKGCAFPCL